MICGARQAHRGSLFLYSAEKTHTIAAPLNSGTTAGDGTYPNDTLVTVTATPAAGFAFANWTEHGKIVSRTAAYSYTTTKWVTAPRPIGVVGTNHHSTNSTTSGTRFFRLYRP